MTASDGQAMLDRGLVEIADAIASKEVSSEEVTQACLDRAERVGPEINCFIEIRAEDALRRAREADAALARGVAPGPLHGVPLAHKDMFYRAGEISACGSKIRRDFVAPDTSTVLTKLDAAGALHIARLNMAEFAFGPSGHNEHWGHNRNPWNRDYITGGSSSGSGAAVAARVVFGALGSDTGGSVRLPATICGVVGLKPTSGLISRHAILPVSFTMDTVGPLTRTVRDCARLTRVIAGHDANDPSTDRSAVPDYEATLARGVKGLKIGVPTNYFYDVASDEVRSILDKSLKVFEELGAEIVSVDVTDLERVARLANVVMTSEAATIHGKWVRERPQDYSDQVRSRIELGFYIPATRYLEALDARGRMLAAFCEAVFSKVDVLHTPGIPFASPTIAETDVGASASMAEMIASLSWCTRPFNYLGVPALSVPCGFTANGLPMGFQLAGRPFSEARLFATGHAYQEATEWHARAPDL